MRYNLYERIHGQIYGTVKRHIAKKNLSAVLNVKDETAKLTNDILYLIETKLEELK